MLKTLILSIFILLLGGESAFAQATTLGEMTDSTFNALLPIQIFLSSISYILGVFFAFSALKMARNYTESPGDIKPLHVALRFLAAAFFILTPFAANVLVETISGAGVGGSTAAQLGGVNGPAGGDGLDGVLNRIVSDMWGPLMDNLIPLFCYAAGIILMMVALKRLALASNDGPQAPGGLGTMTTFFVAAGLMSVGYLMNVTQGSLFGENQMFQNIVFVNGNGGEFETRAQEALWGVFMFLRIVGYISFIRGLFMLRGATEGAQNASIMGAITHIGAGAILANGLAFARAIQETIFDDPSNWIFNIS